ncbi:MAG: molybdopterin cofactor-binding domain-containing protein [bacterium]
MIRLTVNGTDHAVDVPDTTPLMYVLRNDLGCKGVRAGCSIGECGACRVIIDGRSLQSCITPVSEVVGARITTPEGLGTPDDPHPVQRAFLNEQAAQCGYCVNGMIMSVAARLGHEPAARAAEMREVLDEHLCRCGTHSRLLRAACRAAGVDEGRTTGADQPAALDAAESPRPPQSVADEPEVQRWLELREDGDVVAYPGKVELGQGLRTAFAQIVAGQLGLAVERVHVRPTVTGRSPDQGNTSGSFSMEHCGVALGMAAVAMRRLLRARAAAELRWPPEEIEFEAGTVVNPATGERVPLARLAAAGPVTGTIEESDLPRWDAAPLGLPVSRDDLRTKLTGAPAYVHDLDFEGMLHARALLPPSLAAEPEGPDVDAVLALPGVRHVVQDGRYVLVVAEREEQAIRAVGRLGLDTRWKRPATIGERDTARLLRSLPSREHVRRRDEAAEDILAAHTSHAASYSRPYQAHGPMAPSAAVAVDDTDGLRLWTHSQGVYPLRRELAAVLGRDEDRIIVTHVDGPGCYGMNGADDAAAFAAIAARAVPGVPVRFQFSLADEFGWEPHGPGMVADLAASVDGGGAIQAWRHNVITDSHSTRPNGDGDRLMAAWLGSPGRERPWVGLGEPGVRNAVPLYDIPALDVVAREVRGPLRTGPLRSLGAFFNVFAGESFMDELAEIAGADPVEFRLAHLRDERAIRVLRVAAEAAGWQPHVGPSGRGLGVALARYKDTKGYAAEVAEVAVDRDSGEFRVLRIVVACDAGAVVNPDGLSNQVEGGVLQGLSRTLYEELHLTADGVLEEDWTGYRSLRFRDVPEIAVTLVNRRDRPPIGVGEVSTPPAPAAVANAVDDAIGIRIRELPITPDRLRRRLEEMSEAEASRVLL